MSDWLSLYHQLPHPLRQLAVTARGAYLQSWRYGAESDSLVSECLERESWTPERWMSWQEERLAHLLERAAKQVPYYRSYWAMRRRNGDRISWNYLENWPILEKDSVRAAPEAFVADDISTRFMFHEHTSGTTGKSLDLWWSLKTVREWYALFEARWRRWYGVSRKDRWGILGGQLVVPQSQSRPPFWVWNAPMHQLYLSSYHLSPALISSYLDAILQHKILYLWGYSSALYTLALEAIRQKRRDVKMIVVISNAEPLYDFQRHAIAEAFDCPVRSTYGMAEIVASASECEDGRMHLWPEAGVIEVIDDDHHVPPGRVGDLVATGLINQDMPLIRYRVGDLVSIPPIETRCSCHRGLPILASIDGRSDDVLFTTNGRRIGRLDTIFKHRLRLIEAQIIQESLDRLRVRYVPAPGFNESDKRSLIQNIQARLGIVQVILEPVTSVPRESNGKFRAVISQLKENARTP